MNDGLEITDPKEINKAFLGFYQNLHSTDYTISVLQKQKKILDSTLGHRMRIP